MTLDSKQRKIVILFLVWLIANAGLFFIYYRLLGLSTGIMNWSIFILFFSAWFLLSLVFQSKWWMFSHIILLIAFYFYSLINYAYFIIFRTFLAPTPTQVQGLNLTTVNFLTEYYSVIPKFMYLLFIGVFMVGMVIVMSARRRLFISKSENHTLNFLKLFTKKVGGAHQRGKLFLTGIVMHGIVIVLLTFFASNPQSSWWDQENYLSDLGVPGFLYSVIISFTDVRPKNIEYSDFMTEDSIASLSPGQQLKKLLQSLSSKIVNPDSHNDYTPRLDRPNIIIYQLESVPAWIERANPNPLAYLELVKEGNISVREFYANSCDTLNAEFATLCSSFPDSQYPVNYLYKNNTYYCLPEILKKEHGYRTALFHSGDIEFYDRDVLSGAWGFDENFFNELYGQKAPDSLVLDDIIGRYALESDQPFFAYLIGFTNHSPHNQEQLEYYQDAFDVTLNRYQGEIPERIATSLLDIDDETLRISLGFIEHINESIEQLFAMLEEKNLLDDTIVVIHGDHRYYNFAPDNNLDHFFDYNQLPFAIYIPEIVDFDFPAIASHIDIAPTILDSMGVQPPSSFVGESLFSALHPNNAITKCLSQASYVDEGSVITGNVHTDVYRNFSREQVIDKMKARQYTDLLRTFIDLSDRYIEDDRLTEGK